VSDSNEQKAGSGEAEYDKESLKNVFLVAILVCLVCSIFVSTAAVTLKPMRLLNQELDQKQNILRAAGLLPEGAKIDSQGRGVDELFAQFQVRAVDLESGEFVDSVNVAAYDPIKAAKQPDQSSDLSEDEDIATIGRREDVSLVYLKRDGDEIETLVLPVRGYGLWGTLYGYLAIEGDLNTVKGIGFYSHKETPGLGGEVDNANWKAQWHDLKLFDESGEPAVSLVKVRSPAGGAAASHEVDALSGATMTSRGVENLVNFWTSELGFGPFLKNLKSAS